MKQLEWSFVLALVAGVGCSEPTPAQPEALVLVPAKEPAPTPQPAPLIAAALPPAEVVSTAVPSAKRSAPLSQAPGKAKVSAPALGKKEARVTKRGSDDFASF